MAIPLESVFAMEPLKPFVDNFTYTLAKDEFFDDFVNTSAAHLTVTGVDNHSTMSMIDGCNNSFGRNAPFSIMSDPDPFSSRSKYLSSSNTWYPAVAANFASAMDQMFTVKHTFDSQNSSYGFGSNSASTSSTSTSTSSTSGSYGSFMNDSLKYTTTSSKDIHPSSASSSPLSSSPSRNSPPPQLSPPSRRRSAELLSASPSVNSPLAKKPKQSTKAKDADVDAMMFRDSFHLVNCNLDTRKFEGWRVYVSESISYPGNAKLFKSKPEINENALILDCQVYNATTLKRLRQCHSCNDYFECKKYFKANPSCKGRICLVKNSKHICVERGGFELNLKFMCCSAHNGGNFLLALSLTDTSCQQVWSSEAHVLVKQWKKSTQKPKSFEVVFNVAPQKSD